MAAKKTAAKKAAAAPVDDVILGEGAIDASGTVGTAEPEPEVLWEFPLPEGHYFHPPVVSPLGHHGANTAERGHVLAIQRLIGAPESGVFDDSTAAAVIAWKEARGLGRSPMIDSEVWQRLRLG